MWIFPNILSSVFSLFILISPGLLGFGFYPYLSHFSTFHHCWCLPVEASWQGILGNALPRHRQTVMATEDGKWVSGKAMQKITRKPVLKVFSSNPVP